MELLPCASSLFTQAMYRSEDKALPEVVRNHENKSHCINTEDVTQSASLLASHRAARLQRFAVLAAARTAHIKPLCAIPSVRGFAPPIRNCAKRAARYLQAARAR